MTGKFWIFLGLGFVVLSTVAAGTGSLALKFEEAAKQAQTAQAAQKSAAPKAGVRQAAQGQTQGQRPPARQGLSQTVAVIAVPRVLLTDGKAAGFGRFTAHSGPVARAQPVNIYFDATGLRTRFANNAVTASMSVDILVRDAQGQTVVVRDNAWQLPLSVAAQRAGPLNQVYGDLSLSGLNFADGHYQIVLRIHDDFSGRFVDRTVEVDVAGGPAAPTQQVSQNQAATPPATPGR